MLGWVLVRHVMRLGDGSWSVVREGCGLEFVFLLVASVAVGLVSYLTTRNLLRAVVASAVLLFGFLFASMVLRFGG